MKYFIVSVGRDTSCDVISHAVSVRMLPKNATIFKQEIMVVEDYSVSAFMFWENSVSTFCTDLIDTLSWRA